MVKYSALVLFVSLAVLWSSANARENKYEDELMNAMTKWIIEEMRGLPEPYKTRITNRLNEAKNREWDSVGEYFKYLHRIVPELLSEIILSGDNEVVPEAKRIFKRHVKELFFG